ncbi:hypothetical protein AUK40_00550 [Candidatus Wirthbacteria bacterium CG2_30_54_11]|uniref:Uncharacterized protein n=1 Tax=Candidatus Wirthbacteria bacterium CG2_30_54_11 TaxID=1817892 RepID=A0A1J5IRK8_9BACT|nr:MAG: hypothetical protein AUK40_00550 [Candidatus Wirthbacteria bacterium CG2_30_54_11]
MTKSHFSSSRLHLIDLLIRTAIFLFVWYLAGFHRKILFDLGAASLAGIRVYQVLWLAVVLVILHAMLPVPGKNMSSGKLFASRYQPSGPHTPELELKIRDYSRKMAVTARRSVVFFAMLLLVPGALFVVGSIDTVSVILFSLFYLVGDAFCVSIWCPFRNWLAHNKCCNTCSIYSWGPIGVFGPLVFIPGFWTQSLAFLSFLALVQWEYLRIRHPERFFELTNTNLRCSNCTGNRGSCLRT